MKKQEQIITTYQQIIQKTELELQNARKRIYYISLLRLIFRYLTFYLIHLAGKTP